MIYLFKMVIVQFAMLNCPDGIETIEQQTGCKHNPVVSTFLRVWQRFV